MISSLGMSFLPATLILAVELVLTHPSTHAKRRTPTPLGTPYAAPGPAAAPVPVAPFTTRSLADQQAALNLSFLATQAGHGGDATDVLISALMAEADPGVVDILSRGNAEALGGRELGKMDVLALKAMRGLINGLLGEGKEAQQVIKVEDGEVGEVGEAAKRKRGSEEMEE